MIPARFESLVFSFLLSVFMSCLSTFVALYTAVGLSENFLGLWLNAWGHSWAVSFPILLLVSKPDIFSHLENKFECWYDFIPRRE